jgi:hypothetical protein
MQNNYANSAMKALHETSTPVTITDDASDKAGANRTLAELRTPSHYTSPGNWNGGAWNFTTIWKCCVFFGKNMLPTFQWQELHNSEHTPPQNGKKFI